MLDSGSSVSLLSQDTAQKLTALNHKSLCLYNYKQHQEMSLPIIDYVGVTVQLNKIEYVVHHDFIIVPKLIAPVILRIDFFQQHICDCLSKNRSSSHHKLKYFFLSSL